MIFPAMMFALGFLCAFLLALAILPPLIRRSSNRKHQPGRKKQLASLKESRAEKDRMRAEFAISLRKQEQTVEMLKTRAQKQLIEIAERNASIRDMRREMSEITALADRRYQEKEQLRSHLSVVNRSRKPIQSAPISTAQPTNSETKTSTASAVEQTPETPIAETAPTGEPRLPGVPSPEKKSIESDALTGKGLAGRIYKLKNNT